MTPTIHISDERLAEISIGLFPFYDEYTRLVSDPGWAVSLETSAMLFHLADQLNPTMMVDLGSGFSSFVLRLWASTHSSCGVLSVDTDPAWLTKTRDHLHSRGLSAGNLRDWDTFRPFGVAANLVFHDLASGALRESAMPVAVASCAPGGVVVFDDMQHEGHREAALRVMEANDMYVLDLKQWTMDSIGRYAIAGVRG